MLILLIFLAELAAAILAFIFREHVSCRTVRSTFDHQSPAGLGVKFQYQNVFKALSVKVTKDEIYSQLKFKLFLTYFYTQLIYVTTLPVFLLLYCDLCRLFV